MFENLVFQGGSVKGVAYVGALEAFGQERLNQVKRIAGTSAGAITAALLATGYSASQVRNELYGLNFESFLDEAGNTHDLLFGLVRGSQNNSGVISQASSASAQSVSHPSAVSTVSTRISNALGIYNGERLRELVENYIYIKTGIHYLTFEELHQLSLKDSKFKDLFVVGVNLSTGLTEVFDYIRTPKIIISDAVRISLSIPLLFKPHARYIKNENGERELASVHLYQDGGLSDNYLIGAFDYKGFVEGRIDIKDPAFFEPAYNPKTVGFRLVSSIQIDYFAGNIEAPATNISGLLPYIKALLFTIRNKQNSDHQLRQDQRRTIYIDHLDIDILAFNLTDDQKGLLIASGREAVETYLNRDNPNPASTPAFFH